MNNQKFSAYLRTINACNDAREWVGEHGGNTDEIWRDCERGDWMGWFLVKAQDRLGITRQQIVLALCDCASLSLRYFEKKHPDDKRPRKAIQTARKWAKGKATEEELRAAAASAAAAAYAAAAASAAAAAYAAAYAAHASAYAAAYAADARKETLKKCADIFRKYFPDLSL